MTVDRMPSAEELSRHVEGVRRLARRLLGDEAAAEDATQEAFLVLLRRMPGHVKDLGAWLRGVLRHKAREARRMEARRTRHEQQVPDRAPPARPEEVAATLEIHKRLLGALRALSEPYRTTVWLRYFEDRSAREIAEVQHLPLETVRTHLKRGVERLRTELDRSHAGSRAAWMAALAPLARAGLPAAGAGASAAASAGVAGGSGAMAMTTTAKAVLVTVLVLAGAAAVALVLRPQGDVSRETARAPASRGQVAPAAADADEEAPLATLASDDGDPGEREPHLEGARGASAPSAPAVVKAPAHEGRFAFHYQQGFSFLRREVVPPQEADLVFESAAGGIASVSLTAPGGVIRDLALLHSEVPEVKHAIALFQALVRADPETVFARTTGARGYSSATSDVFLLRTRRGEWVKGAIVARGTEGGWTRKPVEIVYSLVPDEPVFSERRGDLVVDGLEIDVASVPDLEAEAARAAEAAAAEAERERRARAAPQYERLETLDRRATALEAELQAPGEAAVHVAGVLGWKWAGPMGNREAYRAASYSFEHATRDDTEATRNDWDFLLEDWKGRLWLRVRTVTDDRSVVRDLGTVDFATARRGAFPVEEGAERAEAVQGHTYVIHTLDTESDYWALLQIVELDSRASMLFEWQVLDDPGPLRDALTPTERLLLKPSARLQLRGGAGGGNPNQVFLDGTTNAYVDEVADEPLSMEGRPTIRERIRAWADGGYVPPGQVFLVESIEITARADGDSNGPGEALLVVGGVEVFHLAEPERGVEDAPQILYTVEGGREEVASEDLPVRRRLVLPIPVRNGEEKLVYAEIANSSLMDVVLTGRFLSEAEAAANPLARAEATGGRQSVARFLRDLADGRITDEHIRSRVARLGPVSRPYLERILAVARGAWHEKVAAALAALPE